MADTQEAIRRLSIQSTSQGVPESTRQLNDLAKAQDNVTVASQATEKATLSLDQKFASMERRYVSTVRQQQDFEKVQRLVNLAVAQNPELVERANALLAAAAEKHKNVAKAANDNTAAASLNTAQIAELGHAAKAAFEQVAAGAPVLRVLAQQGASTAQALSLGQGGLAGSLKSIGGSLVTILGPLGLVAAALLAVEVAAIAYFTLLKKEGPTAEALLTEQDRLLKVIRDSYDEVTKSAKNWIEQGKESTRLLLLQQEIDLQDKLRESVGKTIQKLTTASDLGGTALGGLFGFKGALVVRDQFAPFEDAIIRLQEGFKRGTPDVREFQEEIAKIGLAAPEFQKVAAELIRGSEDAAKFEKAIKQIKDALDLINGKEVGDEGRKRLGLPEPQRGPDPFQAQENSIRKHTASVIADTAAVGASVGEHARLRAEAQLNEAATRNGAKATEEQTRKIRELSMAAGEAAQKQAEKQAQDQANFDRQTTFLTETERQIATIQRQLHGNDWENWMNDGLSASLRLNANLKAINDTFNQFANTTSSNVTSSLVDILNGTTSLSQGFKNLGSTIVRAAEEAIIKLLIMKPLVESLQSSFASFLGGPAGPISLGGPAGPTPLASAHGNVFDAGNVIPFARGGVVGSPSLAPMALMGEAGPEAIVPLRRGPDGNLGVASSGGGGNNVQVNVINQADGTQVRTEKRREGNIDIHDIVIASVKQGVANGDLDGAMGVRYGSRPRTAAR